MMTAAVKTVHIPSRGKTRKNGEIHEYKGYMYVGMTLTKSFEVVDHAAKFTNDREGINRA